MVYRAIDVLAVAAGHGDVERLEEWLAGYDYDDELFAAEAWRVVAHARQLDCLPNELACQVRSKRAAAIPRARIDDDRECPMLEPVVGGFACKCGYRTSSDAYIAHRVRALLPDVLAAAQPRQIPAYSIVADAFPAETNGMIRPIMDVPIATVAFDAEWDSTAAVDVIAVACTIQEMVDAPVPDVFVGCDVAAWDKVTPAFALVRDGDTDHAFAVLADGQIHIAPTLTAGVRMWFRVAAEAMQNDRLAAIMAAIESGDFSVFSPHVEAFDSRAADP